jgi:uncharacterized membrane protein YozB (DUF420 family)
VNAVAPASRASAAHLRLLLVLALLGTLLLWFLSGRVHYATDYSPHSYSDYYWARRGALIPHLAGGALAVCAGLVQIWLGLTGRTAGLHRILGKVYAAGVLTGSLGGLSMAFRVPGHLDYASGLGMLAIAWLLTTGMALYAIRRRDFAQHRAFMLRSYTVTFAFVTFRLFSQWLHRFIAVPDDEIADQIDTLMAWACWAVPLLLVEPLIQLHAMRQGARRALARGSGIVRISSGGDLN